MGVTIVLFAKYVVDQWYLPVQGATTAIIAQTAFAVYIWILNLEIERQIAEDHGPRGCLGPKKWRVGNYPPLQKMWAPKFKSYSSRR